MLIVEILGVLLIGLVIAKTLTNALFGWYMLRQVRYPQRVTLSDMKYAGEILDEWMNKQ